MIEKSAKKAGKQFPLVMLHDIGWPYGRRDLYYDPETIPVAYRKPYKRAGILLEHAVLAEQGGLNAHLNNAVYENNQQNGVLTAVEDFLEGNTQQLQFIKIPGLYGLGIIYPDELLQLNPAFAEWTRELATSSLSWAISEEIEKARILTEVARQEKEREAREHKRQEAVLRQEVDALKDRLVNQEKELQVAKEASQKSLQTKERVEVA
jgi:hypothetical protein